MIWSKIAKVVIGDAVNMTGHEELLRCHGVEVVVLNHQPSIDMWNHFAARSPDKLAAL